MSGNIAVIYAGDLAGMAETFGEAAAHLAARVRLLCVGGDQSDERAGGDPRADLGDLEWADGIAFGTPIGDGAPAPILMRFIASTEPLWSSGRPGREKIYVHDEGFYAGHDIELRLGRSATSLNTTTNELALDDGERLRYDRLLLTTGAEPRRLQIPGSELDEVLYLRSVEDSDALRERLDRGGKVVVIGAGWIGAEVAASARQRGLEVTVLEPMGVPLERVLGSEVGGIYRDIHADHGVQMLLGTAVDAFEGTRSVERVRTSDGRKLECDFVVVGVGVQPRVGLAAQAGITVDNGILVDEHFQTSAPGVFAAGDVANAQHPFYGERVGVEHWANALHQGPVAARAMLGRSDVYDRLPYFFSDQYEVGMEYSGFARSWDRVLFRGDPGSREFIAFWMTEDRVLAGMNVNVWDVTDPIQCLIRDRVAVDDRQLADPDIPLEDLAPTKEGSSS